MGLKTWIDGVCGGASGLVRRLAGDVRGNVAMLFGLSLPVLILMTFGGVDIHRMSTVRVNLQDALDAAALAAARSPFTADEDLQRVGLAALRANPSVETVERMTGSAMSRAIASGRSLNRSITASAPSSPAGISV